MEGMGENRKGNQNDACFSMYNSKCIVVRGLELHHVAVWTSVYCTGTAPMTYNVISKKNPK